jgi:hypothetical protein
MSRFGIVLMPLLAVVCGVRMQSSFFNDVVEALIQLRIIADIPITVADFNEMVRLNVSEPPECPFTNEFFSCNDRGVLESLTLTVPTLPANQSHPRFFLTSTANVRLRNFVGELIVMSPYSSRKLEIYDSILVNASRPNCEFRSADARVDDCKFFVVFDTERNANFILSNVTIVDNKFQLPQLTRPVNSSIACSFRNVSLSCPIPQWLAHCFNVTTAAMVPCVAQNFNASDAFVALPERCTRRSRGHLTCVTVCNPPPLAGFRCLVPLQLGEMAENGYFPATPGFSTIELFYDFVGIANLLLVRARMTGLLRRVEIYDWYTFNWSVVEVPESPRGINFYPVDSEFGLPPLLTNRVRVTLEQWYVDNDVVNDLSVTRALPGESLVKPKVVTRCAAPDSFSARSNLDEAIGDSFCIGRICQQPCQSEVNFTFDRAVVPEFIAIEGGPLWTGAELVATPSDQTRVYRYNVTSSAVKVLNISVDLTAVTRFRLIGSPANNEPLPAPTLPPRGFPGIFVKRWLRSVPAGFANATTIQATATCPPLPANAVSSTSVANVSFAFTSDGNLLQCRATSWDPVAAKLTVPVVNRNAPVVARKLVAVGHRLLGVVMASNVLHDGSTNRLLVNRRVISTAIDVLDVRENVWFSNVIQHEIRCCNISDVDVVVHRNASAFAVVDRASGAASAFEWRPFPYELTDCGRNSDCRTCLTNEANAELCRWCDTRCVVQLASCFPNESSTINATLCKNVETTTTMTTTQMTTQMTTTGSDGNSSTSSAANDSLVAMTMDDNADPLIPLYAVLGAVGGLAVIGVIVALICKVRKSNGAGEGDKQAGDVQLSERESDNRYSAFDEAATTVVQGAYDDSSVLKD